MNENNKREWVKNAAIIFLVIMLILTFFSNTIMNYSLPEVSAKYVSGGTLSEQIRGSGTVEANQVYEVKINETRTIASVEVKAGDTVEKGQTIFKLEDTDSAELSEAQKTLDSLKLEYEKMLLTSGADTLSIANKEEDIALAKQELSKLGEYREDYEKAKEEVKKYEKLVNDAAEQLTAVSAEDYASLSTADYTKISDAKAKLESAEKSKKESEDKIKKYEDDIAAGANSEEILSAKQAIENKQLEAEQVRQSISREYSKTNLDMDTVNSLTEKLEQIELEIQHLQEDYESKLEKSESYSRNKQLLGGEKTTLSMRQSTYDKAKKKLDDTIAAIKNDIKEKQLNAQQMLDEAKEKEAELQKKASKTVEEAESEIRTMERELKKMRQDAAETSGVENLDIKAKQDALEEQEKLVEKLKAKSIGSEITAQVGGKITEIAYVAGEEAASGSTAAKIEMTEKGYTMEITATIEQAKKVKVGDTAEILYFWYGDAQATLQSISTDKANPAKNRILTFAVTGDVTPGQNLQIAMGSKGQNYEMIVPNSAIREDNNGKFVLSVIAKSSPLGNRYIAERVDVEVLASDDTSSAVSGGLLGGEFIITTSTKPIEAGMQVRLVEQ